MAVSCILCGDHKKCSVTSFSKVCVIQKQSRKYHGTFLRMNSPVNVQLTTQYTAVHLIMARSNTIAMLLYQLFIWLMLRNVLSEGTIMCGEDFVEESHTCCNGQLFETPGTAANGGRCCGFVDVIGYNPRHHICCRGVLYSNTNTYCSTLNVQLFVSRRFGNDNNNCTRNQPCKTIRRSVSSANSGDSIVIDATNTDISPYEECQQQGGETVGIEVKKSLHFLSANGTAVISGSSSCSVFDFDGSQMTLKSREPMEVSLTGLKFINGKTPRSKLGAFVTVSDASLTVTDCEFVDGTANDMTLARQYYAVHYTLKTVIGNSLFNLNFTGVNFTDNIGGIFVAAEQNTSSRDTLVFTMRNSTVHQTMKGAITIKIKKVGKFIGHVEKTVFSDNRHDQGAGIYFEETHDSNGDEHGVTKGSLNRSRGDCSLTDDVINYLDDIRLDSQNGGYLPNEYINSETWRKYLICKADQQLFNETVEMTLDNVNFTNNNVTDAGGALFSAVTGRTTVRMTQVMFEKNSANGLGGRGGALYVRGGQVQIYASDFTDNSATFSGGAVFLDDANGSFVMDGSVLKSTEDVRGQETLLWSMYKGIFLVTNTRFEATTTKHDSVDVFWHESPANISLDKSSSVICSVGYNLTLKQSYNYKHYDVIYSCRPCQHGTYSIERGYSNGTEVTDITCRKCPSGGNCEKPTLRAKSNFWGYEQNRSVSLLLCPPGYCCNGRENGTCDGYQSCQDHRIGAVCGKCEDGYTESVVSTKCLTKKKFSKNSLVFSILFVVVIIVLTAMFVVFSRFWYKKTEHNRGDIEDNSDPRNSEVDDINSTWIGYIKLTFFFYQVIVYLTRPRGKHDSISAVTAVPFIVNLFNFRFVPIS
ncbi:uncharacterized protein [Ptychodera flava]|uniref:uncharacterized protein isoform X2 n=1 Tax=Ptychodera flava TaxID=63121 RepID=UPI00396A069B